MYTFLNFVLGPRLYRIYKTESREGRNYGANALEKWTDNVLKIISLTYSITVYSSPVLLTILYRRGHFTLNVGNETYLFMVRFLGTVSTILISAYCMRGYARYSNVDYRSFIYEYTRLTNSNASPTVVKKALSSFEYEFSYWPIEYDASKSSLLDPKKPPKPLEIKESHSILSAILRLPLKLISAIAIHTFGKRMMYPGSVGLLQTALDPVLREGRTKLIENYKGNRCRLQTLDNNTIDAMFIDRRDSGNEIGKTLVIGCEGNAGFYEIGTISTPLEKGYKYSLLQRYSVLGWNHPGFGGSTGCPFPDQEVNAIDAVIKFAIENLGFKINEIILFAWSIGGYPATWAAMQYPEVKGLILDASFDDVVPLAVSKMPSSWKPLVVTAIKTYFNLNNSLNLNYFSGPVLFVRRTKDEIINTDEAEPLRTNRANDMLIKLFKQRFPKLFESEDVMWALLDWLSGDQMQQRRIVNQYNVSDELCLATLASYVEKAGAHYPVMIGEEINADEKIRLILYLATKHLVNYESTHCTPLPVQLFTEPFDLFNAISPKASKL
ncbi:abhydrolase domain-containing protein 16A-like protein [Leptotrombidium deliense]|uniref:Abhydrolase domain-containing protein 16A-like protein n=1 Tax=Leptotrombidium deliense TaxID=299467 RepID=A0A443SM77_9ACAR|nr:abhydrolase domain-containing protein 16A-like protein [Leptotrombidium deliense]